ncbi:MAG: 2'-5' RNA ligase family protein [Lewinellaceae bacterium]|nr:2'-5' RNA ligase family protein [Lewinellaceae bacterium]
MSAQKTPEVPECQERGGVLASIYKSTTGIMKALLFFIAILPDEKIQREVTQFKEYAALHFRSSRSLRSPAHITLIPPFQWQAERVGELAPALSPFAEEERSFRLKLNHFSSFAPRVIFVDVERKSELQELQSRLEAYMTAKLGLNLKSHHSFNPHMTVAFKDLHRKVFPEAWAYFSGLNYEREFLADALTLLRHNGKRWEVFRKFVFGGQ